MPDQNTATQNNNNIANNPEIQQIGSDNSYLEVEKLKKKRRNLVIGSFVAFVVILIGAITVIYLYNYHPTPSNKNITLTMWGVRQPESVYSQVIQEYEKLHPNIKIVYDQIPSTNYESDLYSKLSSGINEPDIVTVGNTYIPIFKKYLTPAPASVITTTQYQSIFYPTAAQDFISYGQIYALPSNYDGLALIYNKTEFQNAGLTAPSSNITNFVNEIPKLVIKNNSQTTTQAAVDIGTDTSNINNAYDILYYLMFLNKTSMISNNTVTFANGNNSQEALNLYNQIAQEDGWNSTFPNAVSAFAAGDVAMIFEPSWEIKNILTINPKISIGIVPPPQIPGNNVYLSLYFGKSVTAYSKYPQQAWQFLNYLDQKSTLLTLYNNEVQNGEILGEVFPRKDMANLASQYQYMEPFIQMAPYSKSWEMGDYKKVGAIFDNVIAGNETLQQAQSQVLSLLIKVTHNDYVVPPNE
jgi:ABC-type glycerol-3-phosphate transport system substrate-binding protein